MKKLLALLVGVCLTTSAWGIELNKTSLEPIAGTSTARISIDEISDYITRVVGKENLKGLWFFSGIGNMVIDRSPAKHNANAGWVFSRGNLGLLPTISTGTTAATNWSIDDNDDFTPITGRGFSFILLIAPGGVNNYRYFHKADNNAKMEWEFINIGGNLRFLQYGKLDGSIYQGRSYAMGADTGTWHIYAGTWDGTVGTSGTKIYRDGVRVDTTDVTAGVFANIVNGTSLVSPNWQGTYQGNKYAVTMYVNKNLGESEIKKISDCLLAASRGSLWLK